MLAFKWSWAVPERSADVPRSCRAGIVDFLMVFGGLGGVGAKDVPRRAPCRPGWSGPPKPSFSKTTQAPQAQAQAQAQAQVQAQAQGLGLVCLVFNFDSRRRAKRGGGYSINYN